ncbi:MAG: metal-dependent transcriptional regulator [Bacteroidota bacterium]
MAAHTQAVEDYLKAIYDLSRHDGRATTSALAERLEVSPASVTGMIKKLAATGLVAHEPYAGVALTAAGRRIAVEMIRHHRLVETYLHEALGVPWDRLHDEAEAWEHVLSEDLERRMDEALGHPTHDPHGSPIPTPALELEETDWPPLARLDAEAEGVVREVSDHDPALLRALGEAGLYPGTAFTVLAAPPDSDTYTLQLPDGSEPSLAPEAAAYVFVSHA